MFQTGMCGLRLNLSHRSLEESREWLEIAQKAAESCGVKPQILTDLQGPELRVGRSGLPLELQENAVCKQRCTDGIGIALSDQLTEPRGDRMLLRI